MNKESKFSGSMIEVHYVVFPVSTNNLPGVVAGVLPSCYERMSDMIKVLAKGEAGLGQVVDSTRYYEFSGSNVFFNNVLAQEGKAKTADNVEGFDMIRLFSYDPDALMNLEKTIGRYSE